MSEKTDPLVSVVLPTYDRPEFLIDAVESVVNQTYSAIELLVIDDHSSEPADETLMAISTSDLLSTRVLRHEENKGANVARNTGIENARGEYIAFLDDDDKWDPTKIEQQIGVFQEADNDIGAVYTGQRFVNDEGNITSTYVPTVKGDVTKKLLCGARLAPFPCLMVRTGVIQKAGLPDERFPCWQDKEWYVRLSQWCEFEVIPEPLVTRRIGKHDQIGDDYMKKRDEAYPLFLEKYQSLATGYGRICERKMKAAFTRKLGKTAVNQEKYRESQKQLTKSILYYPFFWKTYLYLMIAMSGKQGYEFARTCKKLYEKQIIRHELVMPSDR